MDMTLNQNAAAEMWRPVILTFESACSFDNPFLDVEILGGVHRPERQGNSP